MNSTPQMNDILTSYDADITLSYPCTPVTPFTEAKGWTGKVCSLQQLVPIYNLHLMGYNLIFECVTTGLVLLNMSTELRQRVYMFMKCLTYLTIIKVLQGDTIHSTRR